MNQIKLCSDMIILHALWTQFNYHNTVRVRYRCFLACRDTFFLCTFKKKKKTLCRFIKDLTPQHMKIPRKPCALSQSVFVWEWTLSLYSTVQHISIKLKYSHSVFTLIIQKKMWRMIYFCHKKERHNVGKRERKSYKARQEPPSIGDIWWYVIDVQ